MENHNHCLFSVIVPAYNVENELERCISSIYGQDYNDFELIIVDDCSTDSTPEIIEKLKRKYHFSVISLDENKGLANARNVALSIAKGNYILFVDSDDFLEFGLFSELNIKKNSDVIIFNHQRVWDDGRKVINIKTSLLNDFSNEVILKDDVKDKCKLFSNLNVAWNKAYSREFLLKNKLTFESGYYEDITFNYRTIILASSISVTSYVGINYYQRPGSILNSKSDKHQDLTLQYRRLFQYFTDADVSNKQLYIDKLEVIFLEHVFNLLTKQNFRLTKRAEKNIVKDFTDICKRFAFKANLTLNQKMKKIYLMYMPTKFHLIIFKVFFYVSSAINKIRR